jgi:hypothetical protein
LQNFSTGTLGEKKANVKLLFSFALPSPLPSAVCLEVIYSRSMDSAAKRSASVTVAAVVAIIASLLLVLVCSIAFLAMLFVKLPGATSELPPYVRSAALAGQGFMICLSLFGLATGIGLIYLRNWARIAVLIWGGFAVFFGIIGIPIAYLAQFTASPNAQALPAESVQAIRWILLFVYGLPLATGVWWLILFNRKTVKGQFAGAPIAADVGLPRKPACPMPIAVLAWFYIASVLNLLFLPLLSFHVPVFVFGSVLHGRAGVLMLVFSSLAFALAGIGLLNIKPWSYSLTIGLQVFWLASSIVSVLNKNYTAVMDTFMKEMQASLHLPETQFSQPSFFHQYGWTVVFGLIVAGAILAMLVYYRPRFLEAATKAASTA